MTRNNVVYKLRCLSDGIGCRSLGSNGGPLAAFVLDLVVAMAYKTNGGSTDWEQEVLHEAMRVLSLLSWSALLNNLSLVVDQS
jgi:hypothetical protein